MHIEGRECFCISGDQIDVNKFHHTRPLLQADHSSCQNSTKWVRRRFEIVIRNEMLEQPVLAHLRVCHTSAGSPVATEKQKRCCGCQLLPLVSLVYDAELTDPINCFTTGDDPEQPRLSHRPRQRCRT